MLSEIGRVAVFIICAQTLLHFRAKESYEKYIKLLISMMVLLFLLCPFVKAVSGTDTETFMQVIAGYEEGLEEAVFCTSGEQTGVEEVVKRMAEEAMIQESLLQEQYAQNGEEGKITTENVGSDIQIETIEIGD